MIELEASLARPLPRFRRLKIAVLALLLAAVAGAAVFLGRSLATRGETLPGVHVLGADVGGLTSGKAAARIEAAADRRLAAWVGVRVGHGRVVLRPRSVLALDLAATTSAALAAGRSSLAARAGALLLPLPVRQDVRPVLRVRPAAYAALMRRLRHAGRAPVPSRVELHGLEPVVSRARAGTRVDGRALLAALERRVLAGHGPVGLF